MLFRSWNVAELFSQMQIGMSLGMFNGGFDAVTVSAWGADFGLLDKDGELMENPVHSCDGRTQGIIGEISGVIKPEELFERTGIKPVNSKTIFQLAAQLKHEGSTLFRAESLLMMPDLFAYLLTGAKRSELCNAGSTALIDRVTLSWDYPVIDSLRLPRRLFCPIIRAGERIGFLKQEFAGALGTVQIPVLACASNGITSAAAASPCTDEEFLFVTCDERAAVGAELTSAIIADRAFAEGFTNGIGYNGKMLFHKNIMGLQLLNDAMRYYNEACGCEYTLADLEAAARECSSFAGMIYPDDPCFAQPDDIPTKIAEYCRRTNQPAPETAGETAYCIIKSLACEIALTLSEARQIIGRPFNKVYLTGSAAKNTLLCELIARYSRKTVTAGSEEPSALGGGVTSLISLGEIDDIAQAREMLSSPDLTRRYEPDECSVGEINLLRRYIRLARS